MKNTNSNIKLIAESLGLAGEFVTRALDIDLEFPLRDSRGLLEQAKDMYERSASGSNEEQLALILWIFSSKGIQEVMEAYAKGCPYKAIQSFALLRCIDLSTDMLEVKSACRLSDSCSFVRQSAVKRANALI